MRDRAEATVASAVERRGLTSAEAAQRRAAFGSNTLGEGDEEPLWKELLESLVEPLQLLLLAVGVLYAILGELRDAAIIFAVIPYGGGRRRDRPLAVRSEPPEISGYA